MEDLPPARLPKLREVVSSDREISPPSSRLHIGIERLTTQRSVSSHTERRQRLDKLKQNRRKRNLQEEEFRGDWADRECRRKWDQLRHERRERNPKNMRLPELSNRPPPSPKIDRIAVGRIEDLLAHSGEVSSSELGLTLTLPLNPRLKPLGGGAQDSPLLDEDDVDAPMVDQEKPLVPVPPPGPAPDRARSRPQGAVQTLRPAGEEHVDSRPHTTSEEQPDASRVHHDSIESPGSCMDVSPEFATSPANLAVASEVVDGLLRHALNHTDSQRSLVELPSVEEAGDTEMFALGHAQQVQAKSATDEHRNTDVEDETLGSVSCNKNNLPVEEPTDAVTKKFEVVDGKEESLGPACDRKTIIQREDDAASAPITVDVKAWSELQHEKHMPEEETETSTAPPSKILSQEPTVVDGEDEFARATQCEETHRPEKESSTLVALTAEVETPKFANAPFVFDRRDGDSSPAEPAAEKQAIGQNLHWVEDPSVTLRGILAECYRAVSSKTAIQLWVQGVRNEHANKADSQLAPAQEVPAAEAAFGHVQAPQAEGQLPSTEELPSTEALDSEHHSDREQHLLAAGKNVENTSESSVPMPQAHPVANVSTQSPHIQGAEDSQEQGYVLDLNRQLKADDLKHLRKKDMLWHQWPTMGDRLAEKTPWSQLSQDRSNKEESKRASTPLSLQWFRQRWSDVRKAVLPDEASRPPSALSRDYRLADLVSPEAFQRKLVELHREQCGEQLQLISSGDVNPPLMQVLGSSLPPPPDFAPPVRPEDGAQQQTIVAALGAHAAGPQQGAIAAALKAHANNVDDGLGARQQEAIAAALSTHATNVDGGLDAGQRTIAAALGAHATDVDGGLGAGQQEAIAAALSTHATNVDGGLDAGQRTIAAALGAHATDVDGGSDARQPTQASEPSARAADADAKQQSVAAALGAHVIAMDQDVGA